MGSATKYPGGIGELEIDPILHTYDNLIATLEKNGYEEGENLFTFPYEWRDSNIQTAQKLKEEINEVKNRTGRPKVDLVAHSMGGLVARYYIEGNNYENNVDQLITLGTPHKGAPEAYLKWEAGEGFFTLFDIVAKKLFELEAKHSGHSDLRDYIQSRILSVRELLPDYDYLEEASNGEIRNYPNNHPRNTFLEFLDSPSRLNKMNDVSFINVVGNTEENDTITRFRVTDSSAKGIWEHGMPENFYDNTTNRGITNGPGDETVPLSSSEGIESYKKIVLNSSHGDLPTSAQCNVFKELSGSQNCSAANIFDRVTDILTFGVFSPVDVLIESPGRKRIGKDFDTGKDVNEIKGAFYSGHETENEFITIPNPEDGEYKILTQGTGAGDYKIEIAKISDFADSADETEVEITGTAEIGKTEESTVKIEGMKVEKMTVPNTPNNDSTDSSSDYDESGASETKISISNRTNIQNLDVLKGKVRQYFNDGKIRSRKEAKNISKELGHIRINLKKYSLETKLKKIKKYQFKVNACIRKLKRRIGRDSPKVIDADAAESLIADLDDLKID